MRYSLGYHGSNEVKLEVANKELLTWKGRSNVIDVWL